MTKISIWACSLICALIASACGDSGTTEISRTVAEKRQADSATDINGTSDALKTSKRKRRGSVSLGNDTYDLNVVLCMGTTTTTVTASDSQSRSDYPVVAVKIYDPAMSGGMSINTASAIFERDGYGEHWKLHEGLVERNGDVVTASGTLKGNLLLPKPDGTRESAPLEGDDVLPFAIRIEC